jgi:hypothetical protein
MFLAGLTMLATLRRSWHNAIHSAPPASGQGPSIKPL